MFQKYSKLYFCYIYIYIGILQDVVVYCLHVLSLYTERVVI